MTWEKALKADQAGREAIFPLMRGSSDTYDRNVQGRTLLAEPDARLQETPDGPVLVRGEEFEILEPKTDDEDLLGRFIRLPPPEESPESYLSFARRFGFLDLCEHGLPFTHPSDENCWRRKREPLERWWLWRERAWATLSVAEQVYEGEPGWPTDWELLNTTDWPISGAGRDLEVVETATDLGESVERDREELGFQLDAWLQVAGSRVSPLTASVSIGRSRPFRGTSDFQPAGAAAGRCRRSGVGARNS